MAREKKAPPKFYSIDDDACLLIGVAPPGRVDIPRLARKWTTITAKGAIISGQSLAARYFINGEVGALESARRKLKNWPQGLAGRWKTRLSDEERR
jgi:hypothetical protein